MANYSDNFNRADSSTVTGWTENAGDWTIVSNQLGLGTSTQYGKIIYSSAMETSDYTVTVTGRVGGSSYGFGVLGRASDDSSVTGYWGGGFGSDAFYIVELTNNVENIIASGGTCNSNTTYTLGLTCNGSNLELNYGAGSISGSDASLTSNRVGIAAYGSVTPANGGWFDDWIAADLASLSQYSFRWRNDDGSETTATWANTLNSNITAPSGLRRLRTLIDATGNPANNPYTLYYRETNTPTYTRIPVGSDSKVQPVIESGDATGTAVTTASTTWNINFPSASNGDLLLVLIVWDDSTNVTAVTPPSGPNGETLTPILSSPQASASTEIRLQAWYTVATGSWTAGTRTFTPSASETCVATVVRVLAGEFDASTPIGAFSGRSSAGTAETNVQSPTFTAGASDGSGTLIVLYGSDADAITAPASGTTTIRNQTAGGVGHLVIVRNAAITNSESVAQITATIASDSWASFGCVVRAPTVNNVVYIAPSANIAAGGENTTAQLTAPSGKTTSDFVTGRMWDDENGADSIDITDEDYTELEWSIAIATSGVYLFRVYNDTTALNSYTNTAQWTIGSTGTLYYQTISGLINTARSSGKVIAKTQQNVADVLRQINKSGNKTFTIASNSLSALRKLLPPIIVTQISTASVDRGLIILKSVTQISDLLQSTVKFVEKPITNLIDIALSAVKYARKSHVSVSNLSDTTQLILQKTIDVSLNTTQLIARAILSTIAHRISLAQSQQKIITRSTAHVITLIADVLRNIVQGVQYRVINAAINSTQTYQKNIVKIQSIGIQSVQNLQKTLSKLMTVLASVLNVNQLQLSRVLEFSGTLIDRTQIHVRKIIAPIVNISATLRKFVQQQFINVAPVQSAVIKRSYKSIEFGIIAVVEYSHNIQKSIQSIGTVYAQLRKLLPPLVITTRINVTQTLTTLLNVTIQRALRYHAVMVDFAETSGLKSFGAVIKNVVVNSSRKVVSFVTSRRLKNFD